MADQDYSSTHFATDSSKAIRPSTSKMEADHESFFSPLPPLSKLVRCASTPLSESSLQSLLTLNFEGLTRVSGDFQCNTISEPSESDYFSSPPSKDVTHSNTTQSTLTSDSGLQESQVKLKSTIYINIMFK